MNTNGPKILILTIFEVLNLNFFEQLSSQKFTIIQCSESLKLPKRTFLNRLNSTKFDFTEDWTGSKMIKISTKSSLNLTFSKFLEHSATYWLKQTFFSFAGEHHAAIHTNTAASLTISKWSLLAPMSIILLGRLLLRNSRGLRDSGLGPHL